MPNKYLVLVESPNNLLNLMNYLEIQQNEKHQEYVAKFRFSY